MKLKIVENFTGMLILDDFHSTRVIIHGQVFVFIIVFKPSNLGRIKYTDSVIYFNSESNHMIIKLHISLSHVSIDWLAFFILSNMLHPSFLQVLYKFIPEITVHVWVGIYKGRAHGAKHF